MSWAVLASWILLGGPILALPAAALAPPLLVAAVEWLAGTDRSAATGVRHWLMIVGAAALGVTGASAVDPPWVGGVMALAATLVLFGLVSSSAPHPPALAICLIPQVTGVSSPAVFVASIAGGAAVLYVVASIVHPLTVGAGTRCPGGPGLHRRRSQE